MRMIASSRHYSVASLTMLLLPDKRLSTDINFDLDDNVDSQSGHRAQGKILVPVLNFMLGSG